MALPVAVVGGGISGLSAAHYLRLRGVEALVIEASRSFGGLLCTDCISGCTVEAGADSWLAAKPSARELAAEVGLASEVIGSNDAQRHVSVLRRGKLVPYPRNMQLVVPKRLSTVWKSPLFSLGTKLRMSADWVRFDKGPRADRSVAAFVRSHFGQDAVDYLAEPLLSGIYGGDTENLSAAAVLPKFVERERLQGSITRGISGEAVLPGSIFESMRGGLGQLTVALQPRHSLQGRAETLERDGDGWKMRVNGDWLSCSRVILACPAREAAAILERAAPELSASLARVQSSSAHIVAMGFRNLERLHGFGLLVPKAEGQNLMAATWVTNKFERRAPEGVQVIRAFFRQAPTDPVADLRRVIRINQEPAFVREYHWPNSLPQYAVGHLELVRQIEDQLSRVPNLHLTGNTYHGVGIPDCIRMSKGVVAGIAG